LRKTEDPVGKRSEDVKANKPDNNQKQRSFSMQKLVSQIRTRVIGDVDLP
jgi:hypothetical protein